MEPVFLSLNQKLRSHNKKILYSVLISTVLWGLLAHGTILLNFYFFHDGCGQFDLGTTYNVGRWLLDVFENLHRIVWGLYTYELNWYQGILTIVCIAAANYLIIDLFRIEGMTDIVLLCGVLVAFPSITGLFAYMFTAPYYGLSLIMAVLSAYILCGISEHSASGSEHSASGSEHSAAGKYDLLLCLLSSILLCLSIAIYQGYIPHFLSIILFYLIRNILQGKPASPGRLLKALIPIGATALLGLVLYFISNQLYLAYKDAGMGGYRGLDHYGTTSLRGYLERICKAYRYFFVPDPVNGSNMFPCRLYTVYRYIFVPVIIVLSVFFTVQQFRVSFKSGISLLFLFALVPPAVNFIYIMSGEESAYSLTLYAQSLVFVFLYLLLEQTASRTVRDYAGRCGSSRRKASRLIHLFSVSLLLYSCVFYCKLDNVQYTKLGEYIEQNKSWYTTLVTRIKSTEGFSDELPVVYIGEYNKTDADFYNTQMYDNIAIAPYDNSNMNINGYWWKEQMYIYTGFDPVLGPEEVFSQCSEVQDMPCYPDDGSIDVLYGAVVVKFS